MSSVLGNLVGSLFGGKRQNKVERGTVGQNQVSRSTTAVDEGQVKAKAAAKLALIKTGTGGVLDEAKTGRKKLLGN